MNTSSVDSDDSTTEPNDLEEIDEVEDFIEQYESFHSKIGLLAQVSQISVVAVAATWLAGLFIVNVSHARFEYFTLSPAKAYYIIAGLWFLIPQAMTLTLFLLLLLP